MYDNKDRLVQYAKLPPDAGVRAFSWDDVFQESALKIFRGNPCVEQGKWMSYVLVTLRHTALEMIRRRRPDLLPDRFDRRVESHELPDQDVWDVLDRLVPNQRDLLILHYFEDMQLVEIAALRGIPMGTVKSRLSAARTRFAVIWNRRFGGAEAEDLPPAS